MVPPFSYASCFGESIITVTENDSQQRVSLPQEKQQTDAESNLNVGLRGKGAADQPKRTITESRTAKRY
ncbi:hypothetical protein I010019E5_02770 [Bifidobacterium adolescentis]